jgi:hypothetical protein
VEAENFNLLYVVRCYRNSIIFGAKPAKWKCRFSVRSSMPSSSVSLLGAVLYLETSRWGGVDLAKVLGR